MNHPDDLLGHGVISDVDDEDAFALLVLAWRKVQAEADEALRRAHDLRSGIDAAMIDLGAQEREVHGVAVSRKGKTDFYQDALVPLRELLSEKDLEAALTAEKPAPARRFDIRKIKALIKRGGDIRRVIEAAAYDMPPTTTLKILKETNG